MAARSTMDIYDLTGKKETVNSLTPLSPIYWCNDRGFTINQETHWFANLKHHLGVFGVIYLDLCYETRSGRFITLLNIL